MNRFTLLACAALGLVLVSGCKKGEPLAAVVDGDPISLDQFQHYLMVKPQVQVIVDPSRLQAGSNNQLPQQPYTGQVVGSVGLQALSDLIKQTIVKHLAKNQNVFPSEQQIKDELDDRTKANPNFVRDLTTAGFSLEMIRNDIAVSLSEFNLTTQGITVTDDDVNKYIEEHPKEFVTPESVDMLWILAPDEKTKQAADAALKTGSDFPTVAQKYSAAPNARELTNHFPTTSVPALAAFGPDLMPAIKKLGNTGQTGWIKFTEGWGIFKVLSKTPERKVAIDDTMKKRVKRALMLQKGSQGKDINLRVQDELKRAKIEVMVDSLKAPWEKSLESLQPAPAKAGQ